MAAAATAVRAYEESDLLLSTEEPTPPPPPSALCASLSITCNREHSIKAAIPVRQLQPVTHLDFVSLAPSKVHQGATNIAAQLEHLLVDMEILAIATTCQGQDSQVKAVSTLETD